MELYVYKLYVKPLMNLSSNQRPVLCKVQLWWGSLKHCGDAVNWNVYWQIRTVPLGACWEIHSTEQKDDRSSIEMQAHRYKQEKAHYSVSHIP